MVKIDLSQFQPLLKKFSTLSQELIDELDGELADAARVFAGLAKNKLARNLSGNNNRKTGRLLNSINFAPTGRPLSYEVFAQTNYAAYNEWGTINHVSVPPELADIAIKYKGRGIKKTGGMRPKDFFYSQRAIVIPSLLKRLDTVIQQNLSK